MWALVWLGRALGGLRHSGTGYACNIAKPRLVALDRAAHGQEVKPHWRLSTEPTACCGCMSTGVSCADGLLVYYGRPAAMERENHGRLNDQQRGGGLEHPPMRHIYSRTWNELLPVAARLAGGFVQRIHAYCTQHFTLLRAHSGNGTLRLMGQMGPTRRSSNTAIIVMIFVHVIIMGPRPARYTKYRVRQYTDRGWAALLSPDSGFGFEAEYRLSRGWGPLSSCDKWLEPGGVRPHGSW